MKERFVEEPHLRDVPHVEPDIVQKGDRADRLEHVAALPPVVPEHSPVLESGDRVLDACTTLAVTPPSAITKDAVAPKDRSNQFWNSAVSTVGEHALVISTQRFDLGAAVVHRVVAIAWPTARNGDNP